jgi:hypothetical protein
MIIINILSNKNFQVIILISGSASDNNDKHHWKQQDLRDVSDSGIKCDNKDEYSLKQELSKDGVDSGIVSDDNNKHPFKQEFSSDNTDFWKCKW